MSGRRPADFAVGPTENNGERKILSNNERLSHEEKEKGKNEGSLIIEKKGRTGFKQK